MRDEQIYAIMSRVLASGVATPGAKLVEQRLADLFGITRDRMRRILHRLGHEGRLELVPNRGARVIDAGLFDARIVYDARRILEGGIALSVTERIATRDIDALLAQHEREREAIALGDDQSALRLGGALHIGLADLTQNALVVDTLRSMVDRTSTLLSFFGPADGPACSCREHGMIIEAVATRNPLRAREAMCSHLSLVETRLRMRPRCDSVDVETLVATEVARVKPVDGAIDETPDA
ncbi:GntR family transcriptional regulator [Aureimonas altamirensis]|uniref:GntR family transcriptional regulator n=1 Tax=Aureimonas altamirensis TaxID=370622 RepID=UPI001E3454FC|nr:GntR family transcriptional regulator [Aureimonas altamirensis]UHD47827.1 GntR family transcriptional regulator [Aureimonas altamirensis]